MTESDQKALDDAYGAQIRAIFDGICTDLAIGVDPASEGFDNLLRRASKGIARAKFVKQLIAGLLDEE